MAISDGMKCFLGGVAVLLVLALDHMITRALLRADAEVKAYRNELKNVCEKLAQTREKLWALEDENAALRQSQYPRELDPPEVQPK